MKKTAETIASSNGLTAKKLGLRFDRVALGLLDDLRAAAERLVPAGQVAIITVTAPIRVPSQTAEAIEKKFALLVHRKKSALRMTAYSNLIQIRLVKNTPGRKIKMIGFVHNPTTKAKQLLDLAEAWI